MTSTDPFAAFPRLETERLLLRQVTPDDAEAIFRVFSDAEVTRYYDLAPIVSQDEARAIIERWRQRFAARQTIRWGITRRGEDRVLGTCGLGGDTWLAPVARADVGYDLARDCWRQGIMGEALSVVLQFAFDRAGLNRVGALVMPGNVASMRLLRGLGFQHEGLLREYAFFKGQFQDLHSYSLLRREHEARQQAMSHETVRRIARRDIPTR